MAEHSQRRTRYGALPDSEESARDSKLDYDNIFATTTTPIKIITTTENISTNNSITMSSKSYDSPSVFLSFCPS